MSPIHICPVLKEQHRGTHRERAGRSQNKRGDDFAQCFLYYAVSCTLLLQTQTRGPVYKPEVVPYVVSHGPR